MDQKLAQVEWRSISEVRPYAANAKKHPRSQVAKVAELIRTYGWTYPILVDGSGEIVAGHCRREAAILLGLAEVPTLAVTHLTPDQVRAYRLADNRSAEDGSWDEEILAREIAALSLAGMDLALTAFDSRECDRMLASLDPLRTGGRKEAIPATAPEARVKPGDLWVLGDHRLFCGDCRRPQDLARALGLGGPGPSAGPRRWSLLITDPPYGVAYGSKNVDLNALDGGARIETEIVDDALTPEEMGDLWRAAFGTAATLAKPGAAYYVTSPQGGDLLVALATALKDSGFPLRHTLIWVKNGHVLGRGDYHHRHELILYGWIPGAAHLWNGGHSQDSVWEVDRPMRNDLHPTMKPVALYERAVENSSARGDVVLDLFAGSGPVFLAAEGLGRAAVGVEVSPAYCDVILARWEAYTGRRAALEAQASTPWVPTPERPKPAASSKKPRRRAKDGGKA